jgi:hypothetical protein
MLGSVELKFCDFGKRAVGFTRKVFFLRKLCVNRNSNWASMLIGHRQ